MSSGPAAALGGIGGLLAQTGETALGFGIGQALSAVLQPEATSLAQQSWKADPSQALDAQTVALLVRLGVLDLSAAAGESVLTGISSGRLGHLVAATRTPPTPDQLLELRRRGKIDDAQLRTILQRAGLDGQYVDNYLDLVRVHLSPADAAMARQQGFVDVTQAHEVAALAGITPADADLLYEMSGLPPGIVEALQMLRRGIIDEQLFEQIVREGHTKTKYVPQLLAMKFQPLSPSIAAESVVRERMTADAGRAIAAANGMQPADFDRYVEMLGRPMGIGQALTLVRRGQMDNAGFREVVARSDVRTEYSDDLLKLQTVYPPLFQIMRLVQNGAIDDATALDILDKEGYERSLAEQIIAAAHAHRTGATKHLAASLVSTLFEAGIETHEAAEQAIEALGYTTEQATEYLQLHTARRIVGELVHLVNLTRTRYTGWKIDQVQAQDTLAGASLDPATVRRLLDWWKVERDANAPVLTVGEILAAHHYDRFTYDEASAKLVALGWHPDDALTLIWNRNHGDPRPGAQQPSPTGQPGSTGSTGQT